MNPAGPLTLAPIMVRKRTVLESRRKAKGKDPHNPWKGRPINLWGETTRLYDDQVMASHRKSTINKNVGQGPNRGGRGRGSKRPRHYIRDATKVEVE